MGNDYSIFVTDPAGNHVAGWYAADGDGFDMHEWNRTLVTTQAETGEISLVIHLPQYRAVRGTITNRAGTPVAGVQVGARLRDGAYSDFTHSADDGTFSVRTIGGADFRFSVSPAGETYLDGWLGSSGFVATAEEADWRRIPDADVEQFDIVLAPIPVIHGRAFDVDGNALAGIEVQLAGSRTAPAVTDADGRYTIRTQPGSYMLSFHDPAGQFADCYYDPRGYRLDGGGAAVIVGVTDVSGVDMRLPRRVTVSGTVRNAAGEPLSGIRVHLYQWDPSVTTDASGSWSFTINPANVWFSIDASYRYFGGYYATSGVVATQAEATVIEAIGHDFTGLDVMLVPYPQVAGRLTNSGGQPIAGHRVGLYRPADFYASPMSSTTTDPDGRFVLNVYAGAGSYLLGSAADSIYTDGWYLPSGWTRNPTDAALIQVGTDDITGIEMKAGAFPVIHATIRDAAGNAPAGLSILVTDGSSGSGGGWREELAADGTVTVRLAGNLDRPLTAWRIGFVGTDYVTTWWNGSSLLENPNQGPAAKLAYDQVVDVIGVVRHKIVVSGTLVDAGGRPISGSKIAAYQDGRRVELVALGDGGTFQMTLPGGAYRFAHCDWDGRPTGTWWGATGSGVAIGTVEPLVRDFDDLQLALTLPNVATIAGRVKGSGGKGIAGVEVDVFLYSGRFGQVTTESGGFWSIAVPPGRYLVGYYDPKGRYALGWYATKGYRLDESAASWIDVTETNRRVASM